MQFILKVENFRWLKRGFAGVLIVMQSIGGALAVPPGNGLGNYISIQGASNLHEFELTHHSPLFNEANEATSSGHYRSIRISVEGFTAPNKKMVADFRKMVHASEYPFIKIAFEKKGTASLDPISGLTEFITRISIAGETQQYLVPCNVYSENHSDYILEGRLEVKLSDFGIEPPEKVFGLIKVKNTVFINFAFRFVSEEVLTEIIQF